MVYFDKINPSCASFALPHIRNYFEIRVGCANNMHPFVYDEELKWGIQGYLLCLLANRLKLQPEPFGCKHARASIT